MRSTGTNYIKPMDENVRQAAAHLKKGHVILYPTDTIWGLGCDPNNQEAVDRIFEIKKREKNKPLIILVDTIDRLRSIVPKIHPHLENILHFNERPLTIIFPKSNTTWATGITSENGSVAIRVVENEFCKKLIGEIDQPLVSTSANISSDPYPESFADIPATVIDKVDYIVPPEIETEQKKAKPSLIAKYSDKQKELVFLRQ